MRSYWIRVGHKSNDSVLIRRGRFETYRKTDTQRQRLCEREAETGMMQLQTKELQGFFINHQKLGESHETESPANPLEPNLQTP